MLQFNFFHPSGSGKQIILGSNKQLNSFKRSPGLRHFIVQSSVCLSVKLIWQQINTILFYTVFRYRTIFSVLKAFWLLLDCHPSSTKQSHLVVLVAIWKQWPVIRTQSAETDIHHLHHESLAPQRISQQASWWAPILHIVWQLINKAPSCSFSCSLIYQAVITPNGWIHVFDFTLDALAPIRAWDRHTTSTLACDGFADRYQVNTDLSADIF